MPVYPVKLNAENCSRLEIIAWLNDTLQANFNQIEELCSGAAYCQLMESLFPGSISMKRVVFCTNFRHEYKRNFTILQASFRKMHVDKIIPIEKLINGGYQDNFEFLQWFKKFYDANYMGKEYNAVAARDGLPMGSGSNKVKSTKCRKPIVNKMNRTINRAAPTASASNTSSFENSIGAIKENQQFAASLPVTTVRSTESLSPTCKKITIKRLEKLSTEVLNFHLPSLGISPESGKSSSLSNKTKTGSGNRNSYASSTSNNLDAPQKSDMETFTLKRQFEYLKNQVLNMERIIGELEKHRDFYLSKLRNIEILCKETEENEASSMVQNVKYILYATEEFFETPDNNQNDEDKE